MQKWRNSNALVMDLHLFLHQSLENDVYWLSMAIILHQNILGHKVNNM